ncbi:MAG: Jag N-terminal domain-containing protein [Deltaproteobacteria bacterium]|nr:Jag N-terminal domain-containing protein [Deltaproteobacteria bacterium]MBW2660792.1 Jag N-terminal domain-containing protein [Deltaproteobacteria bacterium]
MSPGLEFEGKNVEQALQKACNELSISKEKLKHDVISYGSTGIFGLVGSKKAKIRVIVPEKATGVVFPSKPETNPQPLPQQEPQIEAQTVQADLEADKAYDEAVDLGRNVLQQIIDFITTDASISIKRNSGNVFFDITGGISALLIGKHGQTLEAMQHLTEKAINNNIEQRIRVQVDVEGYLEARRASLKKLVKRLSEKVKNTEKPVNIGQMNAYDRRIVYLALKKDANITVKSIGEGFIKKMMIFPKKSSARNRKT